MHTLTRFGLALLSLIFALVALIGLGAPEILFAPLDVSLHTAEGAAEIRAAYFGLFGATAALFAMGAASERHRSSALWVATLILGGFTLGRILSGFVDGPPTHPIAILNLVAESIGFLCATAFLVAHLRRIQSVSEANATV
jgi:hypothetical protein